MFIIIWNVMKIGEKQRTMLAQYMLSATCSVCVVMSDFLILHIYQGN